MQDIPDPGFAAKKLAACTLAALRIQASGALQLGPEDNRIADEQIEVTWNSVESVIETNMAAAFERRDELMRGKQAPDTKERIETLGDETTYEIVDYSKIFTFSKGGVGLLESC